MKEFDELNNNELNNDDQIVFDVNEATEISDKIKVKDFDKVKVNSMRESFNEDEVSDFVDELKEDENVDSLLDEIKLQEVYEFNDEETENLRRRSEKQGVILTNDIIYRYKMGDNSPLDDQTINDIALYFAFKSKENVVLNDKKDLEEAAYIADVKRKQREYLNDPFFVNFIKIDCTPDLIKKYDDRLRNDYFLRFGKKYTGNKADAFEPVFSVYNTLKKTYEEKLSKRLPMFLCDDESRYENIEVFINAIKKEVREEDDYLSKDEPFSAVKIPDAVDYVILKTLNTKAARNSLLESVKVPGTDLIDVNKLNEKIDIMRDELIKDPIFNATLHKRPASKDFYSEYREKMVGGINRNIIDVRNATKKRKKDAKYDEFSKDYLNDKKITIGDKEYDSIKRKYEELTGANKGKDPSEYMKKLTEALESFMMRYDEGEGTVSAAVVDNLNKAAVKYYDERQGAFTGPVTGKGQARLDIAIKVAEFTNQIIKPVNEEMNKAYEANKNKMNTNHAMGK